MTPENREVVDRLASEYALGTLRGPARRRFERWRASTAFVDQRCRFWEEQLMDLAKDLKPVQPPAHVWPAIQRRLNLTTRQAALRRIRSFALAASVVLVVGAAALLYWRSLPAIRPTAVATISAKSGEHLWELEVLGADRLVARAANLPARPPGFDYELWALPAGGAPVSLGVLPAAGASSRALTAIQKQALARSTQVAVSIEPLGGSPTGQPTGAVLYVAPLHTPS
ncbi:MAG TPA: anti-sigma factor [Steroidobacteraceae bacterium]|jgi:anti-sigma-K factor RskA|nr:anti-sigma factor [Steroidobacteraceae bacterium]